MPSPILHVLKAKLSLAYGNTVVSIILNTGDGSEGLPLGKPYVLYGEHSVNRVSFYELFVSSDCIPQECLPCLHFCIEIVSLVNCTSNRHKSKKCKQNFHKILIINIGPKATIKLRTANT